MARFCVCCGKTIEEKEQDVVPLKDGQFVCADCADETRILYPYRYTKVLTQSEIPTFIRVNHRDESYHEMIIQGRRIDPLREMTAEEFRAAFDRSREAAEAQAARYAGAKAVIEADHVKRFFPNSGSEQNPKYGKRKIFGVFGKIVHGQLLPGAEVAVSHKDREVRARIEELWSWDGSSGNGAPVGKASAGTLICMIIRQDMSCVYPGDTLIVN